MIIQITMNQKDRIRTCSFCTFPTTKQADLFRPAFAVLSILIDVGFIVLLVQSVASDEH